MNKSDAKEYLPFVQALADGKTVERQSIGFDKWQNLGDYDFSLPPEYYRIKPEYREYNVYLNASEQPFDVTYATVDTKQGMRTVRVREVIE